MNQQSLAASNCSSGAHESKVSQEGQSIVEETTCEQNYMPMPHIVTRIQQAHLSHHWPQLVALLIQHAPQLLARNQYAVIQTACNELPTPWLNTSPTLLMIAAQAHAQMGDYAVALSLYERAGQQYARAGQGAEQIRCFLEIARLYQLCEDLEAARFYTDQAQGRLSTLHQIDQALLATLHLALARLTPDIGRMRDSAFHAQAALAIAEQLGDTAVQIEAILLLAAVANQTGDSHKSLTLARLALPRVSALPIDNIGWQLRIRNQEAHALWYLARFVEAAQVAESGIACADAVPHTKERIYLRLLLGNIYRAQGHYALAYTCYDQAEALLAPLHFPRYRIWIQAQRAWTLIVQGDGGQGRQLLHAILAECDHGQAMSFHVALAVAYSLDQQEQAAEELLLRSQQFYERSGDPVALCAIHCHLAYVALQQQNVGDAQRYTVLMLQWMAEHNLHYFPYWWHERSVSTVLVFALQQAIYPATVERILCGPLQCALVRVIHPLLSTIDLAQVELPVGLRAQLEPLAPINLAFADNKQAREVLAALLRQGWLCAKHFEELKARLTTGRQRGQANATLLAVFGLYLQGWSRRRIAARLAIAEPTVRNYITLIYEIFAVPASTYAGHEQRRVALLATVRQAGFIEGEKA